MSFLKTILAVALISQSAWAYVPSTSSNSPYTDAMRDGSGNFSAGTISAILNGNANTCTNLSVNGSSTQVWTMTNSSTQGWAAASGGGGITAITGDVTASGTGSVAATVAKIAGVAVGTPSGTGNVVMSASPTLTGTIAGAAETLSSTLVATGAISGSNLTAAGHASSDLATAGGTMGGALTLPNGAAASPALVSGRAATDGLYFSASGAIDFAIAGAHAAEIQASTLNLFNGSNTFALISSSGAGNLSEAGTVFMSANGTTGYVTLLAANNVTSALYPVMGSYSSPVTTPATQTPSSLTNSIASITSFNKNTTVNAVNCFQYAGSSTNINAAICSAPSTQTSGSEVTPLNFFNADAGTLVQHLSISSKGQVTYSGHAPTVSSCGTSPSAVTGADNAFKVTVGSSGTLTGCVVTTATPPPTGGICKCVDNTNSASFVLEAPFSGSSTFTITPYSRTTGLATSFTASDLVSCGCIYF